MNLFSSESGSSVLCRTRGPAFFPPSAGRSGWAKEKQVGQQGDVSSFAKRRGLKRFEQGMREESGLKLTGEEAWQEEITQVASS